METHTYMAASVPRYLRQTKLGYLPLNVVIGSHSTRASQGTLLVYDVLMLPVRQFYRMRLNVAAQFVLTPTPMPGGSSFTPIFVLGDTKQVVVPQNEPDPEAYAKNYFLKAFRLMAPEDLTNDCD